MDNFPFFRVPDSHLPSLLGSSKYQEMGNKQNWKTQENKPTNIEKLVVVMEAQDCKNHSLN
jgi:hypothetical protein